MAFTYSDLFTYESFYIFMNTCMIEYTGVTLLKDMCGKKTGSNVNKMVFNPKDGSWIVHSHKKKKTTKVVEFKGVHTRFEESSLDKVYSSTFKIFSGRNRVKQIDSDVFDEFSRYIYDIGSGSKDNVVINNSTDLIRVEGVNLENKFDIKKRYKIPSGKYSFVRIY